MKIPIASAPRSSHLRSSANGEGVCGSGCMLRQWRNLILGRRDAYPTSFHLMNHQNILGHRIKIRPGDEDHSVSLGDQALLAAPSVDESSKLRAVMDRSARERADAPE